MSQERIGFIGLGAMGVGMASNVLKAGYPLSILGHRRREPVERLVAEGALEVSTPAELATASDIIILCVTTSDAVEALVTGKDGLLEAKDPAFLLIDCGTSKPESTAALGKQLEAVGCSMMDVPLGRSAVAAEAGTLNMMAGGSEADFIRAKPVLDTMSENLFHVGTLGTGHRIKLINNAFSLSVAATAAETMATAKAAGIDLKYLYDVMAAGPNRSDFFDWMMAAALEGDEKKLDFSIANGFKDVGYFNSMADSVGTSATVPRAAEVLLREAVEAGEGDTTIPGLMRIVAAKSSGQSSGKA